MKLYQSETSPFVRIARAAALVKGLEDRLEMVAAREGNLDFEAVNPLNKIPALETDDGEVLIESRLIARHFDEVGDGPALYPDDPAGLRRTLQREALVQGVMDAVVLRRQETRRPDSERSAWWDERQQRKITHGLGHIEKNLEAFTKDGIVPITLACCLHFMDRVLGDYDWRADHPKLAAWYEDYRKTPHMAATEPKG